MYEVNQSQSPERAIFATLLLFWYGGGVHSPASEITFYGSRNVD
jgi:hypothetical protein